MPFRHRPRDEMGIPRSDYLGIIAGYTAHLIAHDDGVPAVFSGGDVFPALAVGQRGDPGILRPVALPDIHGCAGDLHLLAGYLRRGIAAGISAALRINRGHLRHVGIGVIFAGLLYARLRLERAQSGLGIVAEIAVDAIRPEIIAQARQRLLHFSHVRSCRAVGQDAGAELNCGKLTAKLRDAVPVCFIEEGKEIKRLKNIEIPDAIKELEYKGFKFDVPMSGAITFKIYFEPGTLPETWPELRQRKTRKPTPADPEPTPADPTQDAVAALTDAMDQAREEGQPVDEIAQAAANGAEITTEIIESEDGGHEIIITAEDDPEDELLPETMTVHYEVLSIVMRKIIRRLWM